MPSARSAERGEQSVDPGIVEAARNGRKNWQVGVGQTRLRRMIAPPLLAHVPQTVLRAALVALVEHDQICVVQHVDLFQLARGAVLPRHDVDRHVGEIHDFGIGLTRARGLHDDEIEPGGLIELNDFLQHRGGRQMLPPRGQRAHEDVVRAEAVHADAVTEQGAPAAAAGRIHGDHGDLPVGKLSRQPRKQLVGEARLAGAAMSRRSTRRTRGLRKRQRSCRTRPRCSSSGRRRKTASPDRSRSSPTPQPRA